MAVLNKIREINSGISDFLQIKFFNNSFFYINMWHIIHFFSGFFIMLILDKKIKKFKHKYLLLFQLLILWELFELFVRNMNINFWGFLVFKTESIQDILLDIVIGMFGGFLYIKFFQNLITKIFK